MKKTIVLFVSLILVLSLAACGQKSKEDVVKSLNDKVSDMKSYKAKAKMTLKMGEDPQVYDVEIWYKNPDFYRVKLKNENKDQSQMILRNKEGVYVLTPALNKSFHFQSDWPKNSSQAYLYESIVKDIMEDSDASFKATEKHYVFDTKTRYQNNKMLPTQEITFNKKDLTPVTVKIKDPDQNVLVKVDFSKVTFNSSFNKDAFDMQKNMTGAQLGKTVAADGGTGEFTVKYPSNTAGATLVAENEMKVEDGSRFILTYEGARNYTMIVEKADVMETTLASRQMLGDPVDLGFTIGALSDKSVTWTYEGADYTIASNNMTKEELVEVARSVQGTSIK
ncbi:LolA family protein [Bacillus testis]|uniref:LolA family protein n=1 Tax=Bacillus testis TaxID=1622072 RepID=UPI00067EEE16|nr:outer membrane lipoprotein carrier protein LolA [Bacillus testis]